MSRTLLPAVVVSVLFVACSAAWADVYTFSPPDPDLGDLDHSYYYTWGIATPWEPADETPAAATLTFKAIRDWTTEPNVLYVHLLDWASLGIRTGYDNERGGDYFAD